MKIDKVLAVYNTIPLLIVIKYEEDKLLELSLKELKEVDHSLRDAVWKSLIEDYRIFDCQYNPY